jgi:heme/copper-type cytochrome/quinol oxidase subunit 2
MSVPLRLLLVATLILPHTASACAVCFGDPDSPWAKALNWGVLALLAVVLMVLGGIVAFFVFMAKRARLSQIPSAQEELQP